MQVASRTNHALGLGRSAAGGQLPLPWTCKTGPTARHPTTTTTCRSAAPAAPALAPTQQQCGLLLAHLTGGHDFFDPSPAAVAPHLLPLGCSLADLQPDLAQLPDTSLLSDLPSTLSAPLGVQAYLIQLAVAAAAAAALACYQARPRGWARTDLLTVGASPVAGRGLFAAGPIAPGTVLGAYPGRLRTPQEMAAKVNAVPMAASYAFQTDAGTYLDPTDSTGQPSPHPTPGPPWPLPVDQRLAYANEPPAGMGGPNCSVELGAHPEDMLFVSTAAIAAGQEVFIDYGVHYDRSRYSRL